MCALIISLAGCATHSTFAQYHDANLNVCPCEDLGWPSDGEICFLFIRDRFGTNKATLLFEGGRVVARSEEMPPVVCPHTKLSVPIPHRDQSSLASLRMRRVVAHPCGD